MSLFWSPLFFSRRVTAVVLWLTSAIGHTAPSATQSNTNTISHSVTCVAFNQLKSKKTFNSFSFRVDRPENESELINMRQVWGWFSFSNITLINSSKVVDKKVRYISLPCWPNFSIYLAKNGLNIMVLICENFEFKTKRHFRLMENTWCSHLETICPFGKWGEKK